jgi:hypothetical protein
MLSMIVRYGIVALAAALAALNGPEASGCGWPFGGCCGCGSASSCGNRGCGCRKHRCRSKCRKRRCGRCCSCQAAMMGAYASVGMGSGVAAPFAAVPMMAMAMSPPQRPPVVVPPGTLGLTYRQISRLVPENEHPRTGIIEICNVPAGMQVTIAGMEGYLGTNGVWYFRTVHPLLPCTPTVRTAYTCSPFGVPQAGVNYRVFRLIPGRVVSMRW